MDLGIAAEPLLAQEEARNATKVVVKLQLKLYVGAIILPLVGRVSRTTTGPSVRRWSGIPLPAFWREGFQDMDAPHTDRSWGVYLLDRLCLGMILLAVTGIAFILSHR